MVEAARAVAPTAIAHVVVVGAVVYSSATTRAVAAFLGIKAQPCGAVPSMPWNVIVANVDAGEGALPVVQVITPAMFAPAIEVQLGEVPAPAPGAIVGTDPPAIICGIFTAPEKTVLLLPSAIVILQPTAKFEVKQIPAVLGPKAAKNV